MRLDLLLAVFSSGLWAPLALMAFGSLLAVGGGIFLWQRRKKPGRRTTAPRNVADVGAVEETPENAEERTKAPQAASEEMTPLPATASGRRRRSLVGGAEREKGTPSGEAESDSDEETASEATDEPSGLIEPTIEEAEFTEYNENDALDADDSSDFDDAVPVETGLVEAGADEIEAVDTINTETLNDEPFAAGEYEAPAPELDPEWIEPVEELSEEPKAEDMSLEAIAAAAGVTLATATAAMTANDQEEEPLDSDVSVAEKANDAGDDAPAHDEDPAHGDDLPKTPISAEVLAALSRPIVFRQFLPQSPGKDGLSFYGGSPIGPADFQWPRERGAQGGAPLQFVMQWACAQLSEVDSTGLLPQDGVLYCFVNFERGADEEYLASHSFIHHRGSAQAWGPIATPEDAGPALGHLGASELSGCTDAVANADQFVPRELPRFPFAPIAFSHPISDEDNAIFWSDEDAADALLDVQKSGIAVREEANRTAGDYQDLGRPFPAFPHDFGAIRVLSSVMIEALKSPDEFLAETLYPSLSEEERSEQFETWREEAKEIYLLGTQRSPDQRLEQNIADDIWQWFEQRKGILDTNLPNLVEEAIDLSLSVNSEALGNVPAHWIDQAMHNHALATEYEADNGGPNGSRVRAVTPARMFGPATAAPAIADLTRDHILLLELPSDGGPGHQFEGKTLQYWITADDLANGNFDAVKSVVLEPAG